MHISRRFEEKDVNNSVSAKGLQHLHAAVDSVFGYLNPVMNGIRNGQEKTKKLNALLVNKSIFSFSFVRHPYTRYI